MATTVQTPLSSSATGTSMPSASRRAFLGFFLIGVLVAIPGAALPAWGYHLQPPYLTIGFHFLSFAGGVLVALRLSRYFLSRFGVHRLLATSMLIAAMGIVMVEFSGPPRPEAARHFSLWLVGLAQGGIMAATFQLLRRLYEQDPAATVNLAGGLMGLGSLLTALLGALSYSWTEFDGLFILLALAPFGVGAWLYRLGMPMDPEIVDLGFHEVLRESKSPVHVLFAALLFFETAAELSVLQWVALHLILRAGMSPSAAMYFLSFYCAGFGLALSAVGFSFVYPLLVERIGSRFREYHSSLFHGIFGLGMLGGFLAPALIGFLASVSSESSAMAVPLWCSLLVFLLLLLLWVESKISASRVARS
ncbi:MAG: hypothetical protein NTW74_17660 [Acidobacteria bacterium]|nr:hypothetical protein [Acidobacteriota bacterium]